MNRALPASLACILSSATALAQDYDFDWATIDHPGNAAYNGPDPTHAGVIIGAGRVDHTFRISKLETTTAQWMEFLNTFAGNPLPHPFWDDNGPFHWGAEQRNDGSYQLRDMPDASMLPVSSITWRMGGLYCNWLHNGKSSDPASLVTGAYDTSTWGTGLYGSFTDDWTHLPGAKFWIPTFDEQFKAFQYDPNRYGAGQEGWWLARNKSDTPGISGPPGVGTTSAEYDDWGAWDIPLGAYTDSVSPWGLWDTSGGTQEWNERVAPYEDWFPYPNSRGVMGSFAGAGNYTFIMDMAWDQGARSLRDSTVGLRIAGAIPDPPAILLSVPTLLAFLAPRRRR
ncbi:MAG: SUMF1/EgtB/PvdO family nonheme iron enzyme [Phycisphaerales bacterium]